MKSKKSPSRLIVVTAFLIVLALWWSSLLLLPVFLERHYGVTVCETKDAPAESQASSLFECRRQVQEAMGNFGDSFGAVNALFTGLAFAGLVLTLYFHSEGARRVPKPFVIPRLLPREANARISVGMPNRSEGSVNLPVSIILPVSNMSSHPAMNVEVKVSLIGVGSDSNYVLPVPLVQPDSYDCSLSLVVMGPNAQSFVNEVCGAGLRMGVSVQYESIERVKWESKALYLVRSSLNRPDDAKLLADALNGPLEPPAALWESQTTVDLDFEAVSGSWSYGEAADDRQ